MNPGLNEDQKHLDERVIGKEPLWDCDVLTETVQK